MTIKFPYARPHVSESDITAVAQVLRGQFLTQGPQVEAFEAKLAEQVGATDAIACASGTAGLHLAYLAAGLGPERALLTSPITFLATANTAVMCGAAVVFADVEPTTGNLDPDSVRRSLRSSNTPIAAIAPVHLGGRPCDLPALRQVADEFDCIVIEDACHAPGAVYRSADGEAHHVGSSTHSDLAVFSFHAIKHMATGEGGAITTRNPAFAHTMRRLRNHGMTRDPAEWTDPPELDAPWYYEMHELGWNYRLTDIQCALGRSQLAGLAQNLARRRAIADLYRQHLADISHLRLPAPLASKDGHAWHLFSVAIDFPALGKTRGEVMRALANRGVGTQVHYIPIYRQPFYKAQGHAPLPVAEAYYASTLSIPMYDSLDDSDVVEIADIIRNVVAP